MKIGPSSISFYTLLAILAVFLVSATPISLNSCALVARDGGNMLQLILRDQICRRMSPGSGRSTPSPPARGRAPEKKKGVLGKLKSLTIGSSSSKGKGKGVSTSSPPVVSPQASSPARSSPARASPARSESWSPARVRTPDTPSPGSRPTTPGPFPYHDPAPPKQSGAKKAWKSVKKWF